MQGRHQSCTTPARSHCGPACSDNGENIKLFPSIAVKGHASVPILDVHFPNANRALQRTFVLKERSFTSAALVMYRGSLSSLERMQVMSAILCNGQRTEAQAGQWRSLG